MLAKCMLLMLINCSSYDWDIQDIRTYQYHAKDNCITRVIKRGKGDYLFIKVKSLKTSVKNRNPLITGPLRAKMCTIYGRMGRA